MKRKPSERARFEVLMEEVQSQLKIVAEGHSLLVGRADRVDQRLDKMDQRMNRFEQTMEHGFSVLGQRIGFVESAVLDVRGDIKRLDQRMGGLEQRMGDLDQKMGGLEHRFDEHLSAHSN